MNVIFDAPNQTKKRHEKLTVYNAMVFNMNIKEERRMMHLVMRAYGPGGAESLINTPPDRFFSAKDSAVYMLVEWMGEFTFEEEFLDSPAPRPKTAQEIEEDLDDEPKGSSLAELGAKLKALKLPQDTNGSGSSTD